MCLPKQWLKLYILGIKSARGNLVICGTSRLESVMNKFGPSTLVGVEQHKEEVSIDAFSKSRL